MRIPGFYDDVVPPTREERFDLSCLPFEESEFRKVAGVPELVAGEPGFSILECMGIRPTLDVNGIWGGFTGEGSKTIIPAHAHAKVSCRLVPDQDGQKVFELFRDYVLSIAPRGVRVEVAEPRHGERASNRHGPPGRQGRRERARGDVRTAARLDQVRRQHPGRADVRSGPRAARRDARIHESGRQRPRSERDDGPVEL